MDSCFPVGSTVFIALVLCFYFTGIPAAEHTGEDGYAGYGFPLSVTTRWPQAGGVCEVIG